MFGIGEKIVYPMHGSGEIEAIEQKQVGQNVIDYYKVRIYNGSIMLMIPVNNPSGVQLRPVIDKDVAKTVVETFGKEIDEQEIPWNKRYKYNLDRLKTGDIKQVADVLYELIRRERDHGLSTSDRKMYILTKNIFCSELGTALGEEPADIFEQILTRVP